MVAIQPRSTEANKSLLQTTPEVEVVSPRSKTECVPSPMMRNQWFIPILIFIVAAWLRLAGLGDASLWNDELSTWKRAQFDTSLEVIHHAIAYDVHPPGYQLFMHYWLKRSPRPSEIFLRLPSALAGMASVLLMFFWVRRQFSYHAACFASWMLAIIPVAVYYSQEARSYSLLLCMSLVLLNLSDLRARWSLQLFVPLMAFAGLCMAYLHYFGALFVALLLLFKLITDAPYRMRWLSVSMLCFLGYAPWLPFVIKHQEAGPIYIQTPNMLDGLRWIKWTLFDSWMAVFGITGIISRAFFQRSLSNNDQKSILTWVLFIGLFWLTAYLISIFILPVLSFQNMFPVLPLLIAVAALGCGALLKEKFAVSLILAALMVVLAGFQKFSPKQEWREAIALAESWSEEENLPVLAHVWDVDYTMFYRKKTGSIWYSMERLPDEQPMRFVFFQMHRKERVLESWMQTRHCEVVEEQVFQGGRVALVSCRK